MKVGNELFIRYSFGDIQIDAAHLMVYRGTEELQLPPKAVETLVALIERRGRIVSKDELMEAIWTDAVVEESNLSRYIHLLRTQLGTRSGGGEYIETLRRRGYRFSGAVAVREFDAGRANLATLPKSNAEQATKTGLREGTHNRVVRIEDWSHPQEQKGTPATSATESKEGAQAKLKTVGKRQSKRPIVLIGIGTLAVAAVVAFYVLTRSPSPLLTAEDTLVVAEFENRTGDRVFDGTLRQGLMMQLRQSPFLSILPDEQVRETLKLMRRSEDSSVNRNVAREISLRRGLRVFVTGSITKLGEDYVIGLEAVSAESGKPVVIEQVQAKGRESVLGSLSDAATALRAKLGEELASIEKLDVPLEVTTRSLGALRMHTLGWKELAKGKPAAAASFFQKAVEVDPDFASAYGDLSVAYDNSGNRIEAVEAIKEAYKRVETVSEVERYNISDLYHTYVTYQVDERAKLLEMYRELYPRDFRPRLRLATVRIFFGEYDQAIAEARESVRLGSRRSYSEWGRSLIALGRYKEAREILEEAVATGFVWEGFHVQLAEIGVVTGDPALVERETAILDSPEFRPAGLAVRARISLQRGSLREGFAMFSRAIAILKEIGREQRSIALRAEAAFYASLYDRCDIVNEFLEDASGFLLVEGAQGLAANALASCGNDVEAEAKLAELLHLYPKGIFPNRITARIVPALIALNKNDPDVAFEILNDVPPGLDSNGSIVPYLKASALFRIGRTAEAAVEFQRIIDNRGATPLSPIHSLAILGLARSMKGSGKTREAKAAFEVLLDLWKDADSDLPDLIAARSEYASLK